jgi:hypothetical protein
MSRIYDIKRWDALQTRSKGATMNQPALYILDTDNSLHINDFLSTVLVKISGTDSFYDDIFLFANLQPSELTAGYRPNYQHDTKLAVVVPFIMWNGYPKKMGKVEIIPFTNTENVYIPPTVTEEAFTVSSPSILPYTVVIFILLGIYLYLSKRK